MTKQFASTSVSGLRSDFVRGMWKSSIYTKITVHCVEHRELRLPMKACNQHLEGGWLQVFLMGL